jgi:hypothetical protein
VSGYTSAAAGWYPDPVEGAGERWWDGTAWSQHTRSVPTVAPPVPAAQPAPGAAPASASPQTAPAPPYTTTVARRRELPAQTSVTTPWIWFVTLAPFVAVIPVFFVDIESILVRSVVDPQFGSLGLFFDPAYLATTALGWLMYAVAVVCSWLDWRELRHRGVDRPFHWAWAFLSSAVYVIGRSVIVAKVAKGRGRAPMWIVIALMAVTLIAMIAWTARVVGIAVQFAMSYPGFAP